MFPLLFGDPRMEFLSGLRNLGLDAEMAPRGHRLENSRGGGSLGVINLGEGLIRWVNLLKVTYGDGGDYYYADYGIPDRRLTPDYAHQIRLRSRKVRRYPIFGSVSSVRWEGQDAPFQVLAQLNGDTELPVGLATAPDVRIWADGEYRYWVITTPAGHKSILSILHLGGRILVPKRHLWDCYRRIAECLLRATLR